MFCNGKIFDKISRTLSTIEKPGEKWSKTICIHILMKLKINPFSWVEQRFWKIHGFIIKIN